MVSDEGGDEEPDNCAHVHHEDDQVEFDGLFLAAVVTEPIGEGFEGWFGDVLLPVCLVESADVLEAGLDLWGARVGVFVEQEGGDQNQTSTDVTQCAPEHGRDLLVGSHRAHPLDQVEEHSLINLTVLRDFFLEKLIGVGHLN